MQTKGQKVALKHAANAIDGTRPAGGIQLGANPNIASSTSVSDAKGRIYPSVYLAKRALGYTPSSQVSAQSHLNFLFGMTPAQAAKVDQVAASTHNVKQRGQRVASFIRRVVEEPGYVGFAGRQTTGAVAATL